MRSRLHQLRILLHLARDLFHARRSTGPAPRGDSLSVGSIIIAPGTIIGKLTVYAMEPIIDQPLRNVARLHAGFLSLPPIAEDHLVHRRRL
jgi:hypothetical protein